MNTVNISKVAYFLTSVIVSIGMAAAQTVISNPVLQNIPALTPDVSTTRFIVSDGDPSTNQGKPGRASTANQVKSVLAASHYLPTSDAWPQAVPNLSSVGVPITDGEIVVQTYSTGETILWVFESGTWFPEPLGESTSNITFAENTTSLTFSDAKATAAVGPEGSQLNWIDAKGLLRTAQYIDGGWRDIGAVNDSFSDNTVYIDLEHGDDATAARERPDNQFSTFAAGYAAAASGDLIIVQGNGFSQVWNINEDKKNSINCEAVPVITTLNITNGANVNFKNGPEIRGRLTVNTGAILSGKIGAMNTLLTNDATLHDLTIGPVGFNIDPEGSAGVGNNGRATITNTNGNLRCVGGLNFVSTVAVLAPGWEIDGGPSNYFSLTVEGDSVCSGLYAQAVSSVGMGKVNLSFNGNVISAGPSPAVIGGGISGFGAAIVISGCPDFSVNVNGRVSAYSNAVYIEDSKGSIQCTSGYYATNTGPLTSGNGFQPSACVLVRNSLDGVTVRGPVAVSGEDSQGPVTASLNSTAFFHIDHIQHNGTSIHGSLNGSDRISTALAHVFGSGAGSLPVAVYYTDVFYDDVGNEIFEGVTDGGAVGNFYINRKSNSNVTTAAVLDQLGVVDAQSTVNNSSELKLSAVVRRYE